MHSLPTSETLAICHNPPRLWVGYEGAWCCICCPPLRLWRYVTILPGYGWYMKVHGAVFCCPPLRLWRYVTILPGYGWDMKVYCHCAPLSYKAQALTKLVIRLPFKNIDCPVRKEMLGIFSFFYLKLQTVINTST